MEEPSPGPRGSVVPEAAPKPMTIKPTPYWEYIRVDSLLSLQGGASSSESELSNDEVMFIVVHQIDELWFKLVLREMVTVRDLFAKPLVPEQALSAASRGIRRMETIVRQLTAHFALMETMTTRDYLAFRDKLRAASGFQSAQMREIEILMGLEESERVPLGRDGSYLAALKERDGSDSDALRRVRARLGDVPTLRDAVLDWVHRTPIQGFVPSQPGDAAAVRTFAEAYLASHGRAAERGLALLRTQGMPDKDVRRFEERAQTEGAEARAYLLAEEVPAGGRDRAARIRAALVFIESYRELPLLAWPREILDGLTSFEQAFVIFRQRHARMVERMIGKRSGTGGSAGVDYLDQTALKYRVFHEFWSVRTLLVGAQDLPHVDKAELYGFAGAQDETS
jgi:tryptophan 2,3-dioxygenase